MTGEGGGERNETIYRCPTCDGVLLITAVPHGVVRGVLCKRCNQRHTVYLGGRQQARKAPTGSVQIVGDGDPRNPPIETWTVLGRPAGQGRR